MERPIRLNDSVSRIQEQLELSLNDYEIIKVYALIIQCI